MGTTTDTKRRRQWGLLLVAAIAAVTGCQETEGTTVGPRGGIVRSDDGRFTLEIPGGALEHAVDITIEEVDCEHEDAVDTCYAVGPVGMPLLQPAKVTYEIEAEMLEDFGVETLTVLVERDEHWDELADRQVRPGQGAVSASAVYLSSYALVAEE